MMFLIVVTAFLSSYSGTVDIDELTAELHIETGMAYISQGLTDKALGEFTTALEVSDDAHEAHLGLARLAVINGSWETAEEQYSIYMNAVPGDYRAPLETAEMLLSARGRYIDAAEYAEAAIALAPLNGQCWLVSGDVEARLGNIDNAIEWYTRVVIEDELLADEARIRMGHLLFRHGNLSEARGILLPASACGHTEADHLLTLIYLEQNDDLRAADSINRYLYLNPDGPWADSARNCLEELSSGNPYNH